MWATKCERLSLFQNRLIILIVIAFIIMHLMFYLTDEKLKTPERKSWEKVQYDKKFVLVTGGAGFVGHHVIMRLKQDNINVIGTDNFNDYYNVSLKYLRSNISGVVQHVDVCDLKKMTEIISDKKITHVIHLAAQAGVRYSLTNPQAYVKSNVECFVQLLETLKNTGIPLIYASSSSVYGKNTNIPFSEDHPVVQPASLYAATKRENELLAHVYWNLYKQRSVGLRFFTVYGPLGRPDMAYFSFAKNILKGLPIPVFNFGKLSRDFTYIDDIVNGIIKCIDVKYDYEILNLGRGEPQSLMQFIKTIEDIAGKKAVLDFKEMVKGDVLVTYADVSKAKTSIGYNPNVSLKDGLTRFISWYKLYSNQPK
ncbi:uncharacterized 37.6 kDa protein in cld 5'region-like [Mytilus trossulus]|uniref:uncharacterized 37.6 kDa protein in cld 5'region-like n=1 Tax=Mytilus trossulus TaxID=6551 RepID=UPI00300786BB